VKALAALLLLALTGCATLEQRAYTAAAADSATTAAGLAMGAVELNPLGAVAAVALKVPILLYADTLPEAERADVHQAIGAIWGGAAINNVCVLVTIASGGASGPACFVVGVAYAAYTWRSTPATPQVKPFAFGEEVAFWTACADYKRTSGEAVRCVFRS